MRVGRRWLLGGLAGAAATPVLGAEPLRRVLFIGNSFTLYHDVPRRVAALAQSSGTPIETHLIARPGARLAGHVRRSEVLTTLSWGWEAVVLQDHTLEGLYNDRSRQSVSAIRLLAERAGGAALVLVVPWSRAAGHKLYRSAAAPGFAAPEDPVDMTRLNTAHYREIAAETGARTANLAAAFETATDAGRKVYASDGYHASPAGATLTAEVIWAALAPVLP